jgi:hypothetical protein
MNSFTKSCDRIRGVLGAANALSVGNRHKHPPLTRRGMAVLTYLGHRRNREAAR